MIEKRESLRASTGHLSYERADDWRMQASCAGMPVELFVPEGKGHSVPPEVLRVCAGCSVIQNCLDFAITSNDIDGFYGGTTPTERRRMKVGATPPVLKRVCACGNLTKQRVAKVCSTCREARVDAAEAARRQRRNARVK